MFKNKKRHFELKSEKCFSGKTKHFILLREKLKRGAPSHNFVVIVGAVIVVAVIVVAGDIDVVVVFRALAWKTCLAFAKESVARKWIRLDF